MLEYLAITSCDDGAVVDVSFRDCQDDPEKVEIKNSVPQNCSRAQRLEGVLIQ